MAFKTGNPLGSTDPRDFSDNSENFDRLANGQDAAYSDRFGNQRKSFSAMEDEFAAFIAASGYEFVGDYAAGITITGYQQVVRDGSGEFWRLDGATNLPYTTTGAGLSEDGAFLVVGDAVLRQELNSNTVGQGSDLVAHTDTTDTVTEALNKRTIYVGSVASLVSVQNAFDGQVFDVTGYHPNSDVGGGAFYWDSAKDKTSHNGGTIIDPDKTFPDFAIPAEVSAWFTGDNTGIGCFVRREVESVYVTFFGAIGDNTFDCSASVQAAINFCSQNNRTLKYSDGTFYQPTTVVMNQAGNIHAYQIEGLGGGNAYATLTRKQMASVIRTDGNDAFVTTIEGFTSSIVFSKLRMIGDPALKTGYLLRITAVEFQLKNFHFTDVNVGYCKGFFSVENGGTYTNLGYTTMTRCNSFETARVVTLESNVGATIFSVNDCLFHATTEYAFHLLKGAELSLVNTWFESCIPAAIYKPSSDFLTLSLYNVYWENASAPGDPSITPMEFGSNTSITIAGKTNLPGSFLVNNPFELNNGSSLSNFSDKEIVIRGVGGTVKTPQTVRLHPNFKSQIHVPVDCAFPENNFESLAGTTISGDLIETLGTSSMPVPYRNYIAPANSTLLYRGSLTQDSAHGEQTLLCATFMYKSLSANNGINTSSVFSIDSVAVSNSNSFNFPTDAETKPYYMILATPIAVGEVPTDCFLETRNSEWESLADVFVGHGTINSMLPTLGRTKKEVSTLAPAASQTFVATQRRNRPFAIKGIFRVNNGSAGYLNIQSFGFNEVGAKTRVQDGTITDVDVSVTVSDGAPEDMLNIQVTNNKATDIYLEFEWSY